MSCSPPCIYTILVPFDSQSLFLLISSIRVRLAIDGATDVADNVEHNVDEDGRTERATHQLLLMLLMACSIAIAPIGLQVSSIIGYSSSSSSSSSSPSSSSDGSTLRGLTVTGGCLVILVFATMLARRVELEREGDHLTLNFIFVSPH